MRHPAEGQILEYFLVSGTPEGEERIEAHLETGCIRCILVARGLMGRARQASRAEMESLHSARRAWSGLALIEERIAREIRLTNLERTVAPALVRELLLLTPEARRSAIRSEGRFSLLGLAERLTRDARSECFTDVARAVELADLAVEAADAADPRLYPPGMVADGRALARGALANACRVRGDLVEADRAIATAWAMAGHGTRDPIVRAELLSLEGSLRIDQARFDDAVELLQVAADLYRRDGNRLLEGKTLLKLGNAAGERGDVEGAVSQLERSRSLLSDEETGELALMAGQALVLLATRGSADAEARVVFQKPCSREAERSWRQALSSGVAWRGPARRIAWREGDVEQAEAELVALRETYAERDEAFDQCLVSLDLAALYLEQGRTADVKELARALAPIFASRRIHHQALAALLLFERAAEAERASASLVREIARYLHRSRNNPYLPFRPSPETDR